MYYCRRHGKYDDGTNSRMENLRHIQLPKTTPIIIWVWGSPLKQWQKNTGSREDQDAFSYNSHLKAGNAIKEGYFKSGILPINVEEVFLDEKGKKKKELLRWIPMKAYARTLHWKGWRNLNQPLRRVVLLPRAIAHKPATELHFVMVMSESIIISWD